jgi:hypothetical protein
MEPHILPKDKELFYRYLDKATRYFEFGCGGSTYQACLRPNIEQIYSVESDRTWHTKLQSSLPKRGGVQLFLVDLKTNGANWGYPGATCTKEEKISYSDSILAIRPEESQRLDLVLIDGRFRVACALKTFNSISDSCILLFDDFLNRPQYHVVLAYYEVVEQTSDKVMAVLRKKSGAAPPSATLIQQYELIAD